ncbi:uroporphyrinogen decarboxylase family protein [Verrucomicrobiota bacterium]
MTSYERVLSAVRHERGDRLPIDYSATPESRAQLKTYLGIEDDEALRKRLGCDMRLVQGRFVGPDDMVGGAGVAAYGKDFLGIVWKPVKNEFATYNEIEFHPLGHVTTVREVEEYSWPSVDWFDYSTLSKDIDRINCDERYCIGFFVGGSFETPWYMRGMSRFLMDLVESPDIAEAISQRATEFYKQRALRAIEEANGKIDLVYSGGDIGTQRGMMISPDLWRKHIKPYSTQLIRTFNDMGLITMYHSCGSIVPVIDDLIEMGLDILDPIQPKAEGMDPVSLKKRFGDRLVFHGAIDEQQLLPYGTVEDVRTEVARLMKELGGDGAFIVCPSHAIQPDTSPENIMALYDTALDT